MLKNGAQLKLLGTNDNFYYVKNTEQGYLEIYGNNRKGLFLTADEAHAPNYFDGTQGYRLLTTEDLKSTKLSLNYAGMISWNASSVAPAPGVAVFGGTGSDQQVYLKFKPAGSTTEYSINCGYNNDAGLSGTFILNTGDRAWSSNGCAGYFIPFA